jgi:phosphatidylserine/phosphatidylglycerophosphate/cardiolipin synthase-like enzyme
VYRAENGCEELILFEPIEELSMLKKSLLLLTLCLLLNFQPSYAAKSKPTQPEPQIEVYFSPNGGCTDAIVKTLGQAKSTLLIQAYSFTSAPIAKAVVDAHKRGVQVNVILDKSQRTEKYSSADFIAHAGIKVQIDDKHKIAHNKIMIIDSNTVITGSFNFTKAAEEGNAENLLIIQSADLAAKYIENWKKHAEHSEAYEGK